jgi:hypothetical protein
MSEPPWATPVSTMTSGWTSQITSCMRTMSSGSWMMGRPNQAKL